MLVASTCLSWIITRRMVVVSIYIVNSCDWMGEELPWAKELLTVLPMVCHVCILGWLHQRIERGLLLTRSLFSKVPTAGFSSHRLGCYSSLVSSQVLQSMGLRNMNRFKGLKPYEIRVSRVIFILDGIITCIRRIELFLSSEARDSETWAHDFFKSSGVWLLRRSPCLKQLRKWEMIFISALCIYIYIRTSL